MPVVCAVNGVAAGAGANLALACDIVLAGKSASFVQAFSRIGLIPDFGGTWVLPRLAGMARARALAILAEPLPAERAAEWGLIWRAVDDAQLMSEAHALAARLAKQATIGIALMTRTPTPPKPTRSTLAQPERDLRDEARPRTARLCGGRPRLSRKTPPESSPASAWPPPPHDHPQKRGRSR